MKQTEFPQEAIHEILFPHFIRPAQFEEVRLSDLSGCVSQIEALWQSNKFRWVDRRKGEDRRQHREKGEGHNRRKKARRNG